MKNTFYILTLIVTISFTSCGIGQGNAKLSTDNYLIVRKNDFRKYKIDSISVSIFENIYHDKVIKDWISIFNIDTAFLTINKNLKQTFNLNLNGTFKNEYIIKKNFTFYNDSESVIYDNEKYYYSYDYNVNKKIVESYLGSFNINNGNIDCFFKIKYNYFRNNSLLSQEEETDTDHEYPTICYLYNKQWQLIGYYKSYKDIDKDSLCKEINDSVNFYGYQKFNNNINTPFWNKIIEESYVKVKNKELLINGKPIKQFLTSIGKQNVNHIIFEITDNYYFFYNIID